MFSELGYSVQAQCFNEKGVQQGKKNNLCIQLPIHIFLNVQRWQQKYAYNPPGDRFYAVTLISQQTSYG